LEENASESKANYDKNAGRSRIRGKKGKWEERKY
jgi:hypothetical protein